MHLKYNVFFHVHRFVQSLQRKTSSKFITAYESFEKRLIYICENTVSGAYEGFSTCISEQIIDNKNCF